MDDSNHASPPAAGQEVAATDDETIAESQAERRSVVVDPSMHGVRLDKFLVEIAPEFSRSHLQSLIEGAHVRVGGNVQRTSSRRVVSGQSVEVELVPTAQTTAFRPEPMALAVVHEDADLLVVDKPAGLVVHPAPGNWSGTLLNGLLAHHPGAAALPRAGIVHRLDKDTSGLMVVAKTLEAMTALVRAIAAREVGRRYLAIVHGDLAQASRTIDAPIGRDPVSRVRMAVVPSGKPARTDVLRLAGDADFSAVKCTLHSGRTHQIRVHLSSVGHPLVGDALYGGKPALGMNRQALHAAELSFAHPTNGQPCEYSSPLPADLAAAWQHFGLPR